ncbi:sel1 repeat family protein [Prevotella sp. tf2-5]|uniref:sel1 repeat family protein n=1 Tax=Prevotella sp. tf2-5 TaxID=1761889 RepID=UPI0008EED8A0|nr:sel1 repeat family protein [Prevotella sp. tf2-5]SFP13663.1 TolA protein [Prevotella sp. tf2-5]
MEQEKLDQLIKSANEGEASSQYDLATYYKDIEDYFNALVWYIKAAEQGYEKALEVLYAPIEIEDKPKIVEIKPLYVIKEEEEIRRKTTILALVEAVERHKRKKEEETKRIELERIRRLAEAENAKNAKRRAEEAARLKAAEEEARRLEEEKARQKAEEARIKAEEEAKRKAEEEAKRKAEEEAKRKAEEEAKRKAEEEAKRKAEEEAKRKAEEEHNLLIKHIKKNSNNRIQAFLEDMVYVQGKETIMRDSNKNAYVKKMEDFLIKKNVVSWDDFKALFIYKLNSVADIHSFIDLMSEVTGYHFSLPSKDQLVYALRGGINCTDAYEYSDRLINLSSEKYHNERTETSEEIIVDYSSIEIRYNIPDWDTHTFRVVCNDLSLIETYKKAAEEEARRIEEEARIKAEEEARIKAEEEAARKLAEDKVRFAPYINSLFNNMIFVEGGEIRVNRIKGINIQTHTVVVDDFCILRGVVNHDAVSKFLYSSIEKNEYECFSEKVVKDFCHKFSRIVGMEFYVPTREQLEGAYNARPYAMSAPPHSREWLDGGGYLGYSSILQVNDAKTEGATFRIVTTDANFISELKQKNNWKSVVNEFLSIQESYEYKHGLFFGDKRKITIITQPITRRVWNSIMNHNGEMELNSNELVPKNELGDFLQKLNESDIDLSQFDYLHNNSYAYVALSARKLIDNKGVYLYIKD